jgi:hypothetical protein
MAPSRRVAGKIRPYFIVGLESGAATFFGLRFVWPDFLAQRRPFLCVDTPQGFWNILRHMVSRSLVAACSLAAFLCPVGLTFPVLAQNPGAQQQGPPGGAPPAPGQTGQPGAAPSLQLQDLPPDAHTLTPEQQAQLKQQEVITAVLRLASMQARWGPELSTPGMSVALVETNRAKNSDGTTRLTFHMTGTGFPVGETLMLVRWPLDAKSENVMSGLVLDAQGTVECGGPRAAAPTAPNAPGASPAPTPTAPNCTTTMQPHQPVEIQVSVGAGEPVRAALIGDTQKNGAAVTTVPFPIAKEDGGCRLQVLLGVKDASMVLIEGTGFPANTPLKLDSTTDGKTRVLHPKTNPDGRLVTVDLPGQKGEANGVTTVTFDGIMHFPSLETNKNPPPPDPTCKPAVTFAWGTGSYKLQ